MGHLAQMQALLLQVKVFKCFMKLNRSLCSSPLSGILNFSLWIAEVLALKLEVSSVAA